MNYIKFLLIFLRVHGLLPSEEINKAGFFDTMRILCLAFPPWIVLFTSIAYAYVNYKTASLADMTDVMCTNFICLIVIINNIILAIKKFEIRAIVIEMRAMVQKRNVFKCCVVVCSLFHFDSTHSEGFPSISRDRPLILSPSIIYFRTSCWTLPQPTVRTCRQMLRCNR